MRRPALLAALLCSLALPALAADDTAALWKAKCANCHGPDGKAQTEMGRKFKVPDLTSARFREDPGHTDAWVKDVIANGVKDSKMKPYKDKLTPEQIDALTVFIRTLK